MHHSRFIEIDDAESCLLIDIAENSINSGLLNNRPASIDDDAIEGILSQPLGSFVTLTKSEELRGCMGCLETSLPLARSVSTNAFNAAFRDPRFPKVNKEEMDSIEIEISILSEMRPVEVESRKELVDLLIPQVDGLLIEDGSRRATFLPQVWEKLPDPESFIGNLMMKAGLPASHWSTGIKVHRYHTVSIHR